MHHFRPNQKFYREGLQDGAASGEGAIYSTLSNQGGHPVDEDVPVHSIQ